VLVIGLNACSHIGKKIHDLAVQTCFDVFDNVTNVLIIIYSRCRDLRHAFGTKSWVATLDRQCERLASGMATNIPIVDVGVISNQEGRKSMMKLVERVVISFYARVSASTTHTWTTLSRTRKGDDPKDRG